MPLYEFKCARCGQLSEHIASYAQREAVRFDCPALFDTAIDAYAQDELDGLTVDSDGFAHCNGKQAYAGLSQCAVGRSHTFGLIMGDGRKVAGMMNGKDAPLKRRQR